MKVKRIPVILVFAVSLSIGNAANRVTIWGTGVVLTNTALNAEFDNLSAGTIDRNSGRWGSNDNIPLTFGSSQNAQFRWDTGQTNPTLMLGLANGAGGSLLIVNKANMSTNYAIAVQSNPAVIVHSNTTTAANYLLLTHDDTNGVINAGAGSIAFQLATTQKAILTSTTFNIASGSAYQINGANVLNASGLMVPTPTSGTILRGNGTNWIATTATYPTTATTTGAYLRADGTNWIMSTLVLPNSATSTRVVYATGTNTFGESANLVFDSTNLTIGSGGSYIVTNASGNTTIASAAGGSTLGSSSGNITTFNSANTAKATIDSAGQLNVLSTHNSVIAAAGVSTLNSESGNIVQFAAAGTVKTYVDATGALIGLNQGVAINGITSVVNSLTVGGSFSGSTPTGITENASLSPSANSDAYGISIGTTLTKASSGTHSTFANAAFFTPTIGAGASTLTESTNVYIQGAPATGTNKYALHVAAGESRIDGDIGDSTNLVPNLYVTKIEGGGSNTDTLFNFQGSITAASAAGYGVRIAPSVTGAANQDIYLIGVGGTLVEAGSGTHPTLAGATFFTPTVTAGAASVTSASTVYIQNAPSASGATNWALNVAAGNVNFGGTSTVATSETVPKVIGGTGTTSTLTLQTTSGVGTTNADMIFLVGNNGGTEAARILNSGRFGVGIAAPLDTFHANGRVVIGSGIWPTVDFAQTNQRALISDTAGVAELALYDNTVGTDDGGILILGARKTTATADMSYSHIYGGRVNATSGSALTYLAFGTSGTLRARFDSSGHFIPDLDNTYNLGQTTGSNLRFKDVLAVTKTSILNVSWGSKKTYVAVAEGPEYRLYDTGTVTLNAGGVGTVTLDPHFVEVANLSMPWQATTSGAKVTAKTPTGFVLSGDPNQVVDWIVMATRAGFENVRWRDPEDLKEPLGLYDPWEAAIRKHKDNNTANELADKRRTKESLPNYKAK